MKRQIRVADGEELDFDQSEVDIDGHAIEFRINAENAANDFQPASGGSLTTYDPPGGVGVRLDDALRQGDELVTDYDSMIAKLIVWGEDRDECLERSLRALREYDIEGIPTIIPFHRLMLTDEAFVQSRHTTKYLDEEMEAERIEEAQQQWGGDDSTSEDDDEDIVEREFTVEVNGKRFEVELEERGAPPIPTGGEANPTGPSPPAAAAGADDDEDEVELAGEGELVDAEMQGTILSVKIDEGDEVAAGDVLVVLEAMKMENDIVASSGGTVTQIAVEEGDSVDMGDSLVVLE